jgi:hypothetical protein
MRRDRTVTLARACIVMFVLSSAFPLIASFMHVDNRPRWLGVADVVVAAMLAMASFATAARTQALVSDVDRAAAFRALSRLASAIPVLLAAYLFVFGETLDWTVLVVGLGWRAWLLLVILPNLVAALATRPLWDPAGQVRAGTSTQ